MSSLVLDLQQDIISNSCDIINVLRKSHLIAVKLGLSEFDEWINYELNGYSYASKCPEYRKIHCVLRWFNPYSGWADTSISDTQFENTITEKKITQSLSEIQTLITKSENGIIIHCNGYETELFNKMFNMPVPIKFAYHVSTASIADIIEKVKNALLEWTLKLESEGIVGDNMIFNDDEKAQAKAMPQTINNYYGNTNIISGSVQGSQIVAGSNNSLSMSREEIETELDKLYNEIKKDTAMSTENISEALEMLSDIQNKLSSGKNTTVIKAFLSGLKDFLITAGGGFVANLTHTLITRL